MSRFIVPALAFLAACSPETDVNKTEVTEEKCDGYVLMDVDAGENACYTTRPYFHFGTLTGAINASSFEIVVAAAPEGSVGIPQLLIDLTVPGSSTWSDELDHRLVIVREDGTTMDVDVDLSSDGNHVLEIGQNTDLSDDYDRDYAIESIPADGEVALTLVFDTEGLDDAGIGLAFSKHQTWFEDVADPWHTTAFQHGEYVAIGL